MGSNRKSGKWGLPPFPQTVGIVRHRRGTPPTFSPADNCHADGTEAAVGRWTRINVVWGLLVPMFALEQDPAIPPAPEEPESKATEPENQPGTADITPPDPTILGPHR